MKLFRVRLTLSFFSFALLLCSQVPSSTASTTMAEVQLRELAPDQSSSNESDDEPQENDNTTMEISSRDPLSRSSSWPRSLQDLQAESATSTDPCRDEEEENGDVESDAADDDDTPCDTKTRFVFATNPIPSHQASSLDRSPSWIQSKSFPPPLISSSSQATAISNVVSSSSQLRTTTLQLHQQALASTAVTANSEGINGSTPTGVAAAQLPVNAQFIYQLAAPAQSVGGIRQSVLTPIFTFLPNAQSLLGSRQVGVGVGAAISQPVILSPPAQALSLPLASSSSASLMSGFATKVTTPNGVATKPKLSLEQPFGGHPQQTHILSTEPTTGQQTFKSTIVDTVTSMARNTSPPRTLASIPLSEMTPLYSELKAFAEEFKNKRIRLGFTQGAVGQSLADKGYSNFAQSTISRFEQMQLSPTNAAAIKLVLEKWLQETENPEAVHSPSSSSPVIASRKRKRRAVFTPQTRTTLESYFKQNPRPNRHIIESVAQELELLPEEVRVWFCNKRQKEKQGTVHTSGGSIPVAYKYPYEHESSVSLSSSGANSPSSLYDSSLCQKRNTPSPPRNTTPFTIEELSKSSCTGTKTITSPMCIANPFATSPQGVVMALTTPRISLSPQPTPSSRVIIPQLQISQTTA